MFWLCDWHFASSVQTGSHMIFEANFSRNLKAVRLKLVLGLLLSLKQRMW